MIKCEKNNTCKYGCDLAFVAQTNNLLYIFKMDILNESGFHRSPAVLNVLKLIRKHVVIMEYFYSQQLQH